MVAKKTSTRKGTKKRVMSTSNIRGHGPTQKQMENHLQDKRKIKGLTILKTKRAYQYDINTKKRKEKLLVEYRQGKGAKKRIYLPYLRLKKLSEKIEADDLEKKQLKKRAPIRYKTLKTLDKKEKEAIIRKRRRKIAENEVNSRIEAQEAKRNNKTRKLLSGKPIKNEPIQSSTSIRVYIQVRVGNATPFYYPTWGNNYFIRNSPISEARMLRIALGSQYEEFMSWIARWKKDRKVYIHNGWTYRRFVTDPNTKEVRMIQSRETYFSGRNMAVFDNGSGNRY